MLIVGPNLTIDRMIGVDRFDAGNIHRAHRVDDDAAERAQDAANSMLRRGAWKVVVTAGGAGAAYAELGPRGLRGWIAAPQVEARNPIGAGDAFAAGLGLRLEDGAPLDAAVAYATAVAAAHVESPSGEISRERVDALAEPPLAGTAAGA